MSSNENRQPELELSIFQFPVIVDTVNAEVEQVSRTWLSNANYNPLYFGTLVDTLFPDYELKYKLGGFESRILTDGTYRAEIEQSPYYQSWRPESSFTPYSDNQFGVYVDTTSIIRDTKYRYNNKNQFLKAYPVIVRNEGSDTTYVGYGNQLPLFLDAKDSTGKWSEVETKFMHICGTGLNSLILPPTEIVLTSTLVHSGDYETLGRLRIGKATSDSFRMRIDYRQFTSMFVNGDYREEYLLERRVKNDSLTTGHTL